ncbi:LexA-binding, inner membrane-associated hydrolase [Azospirillaceae bacterium]
MLDHLKQSAELYAMMLVGVVWPDVDLAIPFVPHRSALTHSVLLALVLLKFLPERVVAGLLLGMAVTLNADLFPHAWTGFATIHVPLVGSLGLLSPVWLLLNVFAALFGAFHLLSDHGRKRPEILPLAATLGLAVLYGLFVEHKIIPLLVFAALGWFALRLYTRVFPQLPTTTNTNSR